MSRPKAWEAIDLPGREVELEGIQTALASSMSIGFHVILITGEPGIGKSRLLADVARSLPTDAGRVLRVNCYEDEASSAYRTIASLLRALFYQLPGFIDEIDPRDRLLLTTLLPELANGDTPGTNAEHMNETDRRLAILDAIARIPRRFAEDHPLLILVDDMQWADEPSLVLLKSLARILRHDAVTLVVTTNDIDLHETDPLGRAMLEFHRERILQQMNLQRLNALATSEVIERQLDAETGTVSRHSVAMIHREAEGEPFYIEELVLHLRETAQLRRGTDGIWEMSGMPVPTLPSHIRGLIGRRLERVSARTREVLGVAAVIGRTFDAELIAGMMAAGEMPGSIPLSAPAVTSALDEAERHRLVSTSVPVGAILAGTAGDRGAQFTFAHQQIRDALYYGLSAHRRKTLHNRAGVMLECDNGGATGTAAIIARHFILAGEVAKAKPYALRASQDAVALRHYDDGLYWIEQSLSLVARFPPHDPGETFASEQLDLLFARDDLLALLDRHAERGQVVGEIERIADLLDDSHRRQAALRTADVTVRSNDLVEARRTAKVALALAVSDSERLAALIAVGQSEVGRTMGEPSPMLRSSEDLERALVAFEQALCLAEQLGDRLNWARLAQEVSVLRWSIDGENDAGIEHARSLALAALETFRELEHRRGETTALIALAYQRPTPKSTGVLDPRDSYVSFLEEIRRLRIAEHQLTRHHGRPREETLALLAIHLYARTNGWYEIALQRGEQALLTASTVRDARLQVLARSGLTETELLLGRGTRALDHSLRAVALLERFPNDDRTAALRDGIVASLAEAHVAAGNAKRGIELARERVTQPSSSVGRTRLIDAKTVLAELLAAIDACDEARRSGTQRSASAWGYVAV